nr:hypothetical protein [Pedobacter panaciterrae]
MPNIKLLFKEAVSQTSLTDVYQVDESNRLVKINLVIGDIGQASISTIKLDDEVLLNEHLGSLVDFSIGRNSAIVNRFLNITTIVTDVSQDHNRTGIDFSIKGGVNLYHCALSKQVSNQGDSVGYKIEIFFYQ